MLEVFYKTDTNQVTAWRSEGRQSVRAIRKGEAKVMLDTKAPTGTALNYIYKPASKGLELRPDYIASLPPRDLAAEIDKINEKLNLQLRK